MSGMSAVFVPALSMFILERAKNYMGLSQVIKMDGPFFVMGFLARNS
jgi:hypothetical protein